MVAGFRGAIDVDGPVACVALKAAEPRSIVYHPLETRLAC